MRDVPSKLNSTGCTNTFVSAQRTVNAPPSGFSSSFRFFRHLVYVALQKDRNIDEEKMRDYVGHVFIGCER